MIDFKRATSKDHFEVIAKLAHDIWHEHYTPIIGKDQVNYMVTKFQTSEAMEQQAEEGYEYYVLDHQNNDVGYLAIEKRSDDLFLSKIYLLKTCRGKGFGKVAFNFIEKRACDLNCKSISLTVNKNNINTIKAYEKIGFINTEAIVMDIGNGFVMDDYRMVKSLA